MQSRSFKLQILARWSFKKRKLTRYHKPSRSLVFCQREVKSAGALTSQLVRVQGEIYHWAGKGNSLAFRSTASHRLAKSTYSYKYVSLNHRYKTNTSTIHTYATGGLRRGELQAIMCRPATRNMSFTHSHRATSAIAAGAGRPSLLGRSDALDVLSAGRPLSVPKNGWNL